MKKILGLGVGLIVVIAGAVTFALVIGSSLIGMMVVTVAGAGGAAVGDHEQQCNWGGGTPADYEGGDWSFGGETFNARQVSNMLVVIGVAKSMYPSNAKQAAIIALITARTESSFKVYANDGVVTNLDRSNTPAWQLEYYPQLAHSLTLTHDAVGTDHSSVGIMQQQVIGGWGTVGASDFRTDINNVIARLMDPAFASARFYESMGKVSNWSTRPAGEVAQTVQVSAFPDAYNAHIPLAEGIWAQFGASAPAVQPPDGIGGIGSPDNPGNGEGCSGGGGGTVPSGNDQQLAQKILDAANQGKVLWWEPDARNQIAAYATGGTVPEACTLDHRVLQTLVMATEMYNVFSINSLNRRCTNDHAGTGQASMHWKGQAIDFGHFNGIQVTGADPESIKFIKAFDAVAPRSSGLGQLDCRGGVKMTTMNEFDDGCHHLHVEFRGDEPLGSSAPS